MSTELIKEEKLNIGAVLAVSLSTVIAMLDSTIANVALPVIAKDFAVSESSSILIINAYQFAVIASLLVFAALGRKVGNKRIFIMGTILFAFSSLGCALSETLNMLTVFRVVQGFGAAAILQRKRGTDKRYLSGQAIRPRIGDKCHGRIRFRSCRAFNSLCNPVHRELELVIYN